MTLTRSVPEEILRCDAWLLRACLTAASEAGEAAMAAQLVSILGDTATAAEHANALIAARRSADLTLTRRAWANLEASAVAPDDLCFALMVGSLFDAVRSNGGGGAADELVCEALAMARRATCELPSTASPTVLTAALGCAIDTAHPTAAREATALLHAVDPAALDLGAQLKVLELCACEADWAGLEKEARDARERRSALWQAPCDAGDCTGDRAADGVSGAAVASATTLATPVPSHLLTTLDATISIARRVASSPEMEDAEGAAASSPVATKAVEELHALRALLVAADEAATASGEATRETATGEPLASSLAAGGDDGSEDTQRDAARRASKRRYSRSIALPGQAAHPLDVLYEVCQYTPFLVEPKPLGDLPSERPRSPRDEYLLMTSEARMIT